MNVEGLEKLQRRWARVPDEVRKEVRFVMEDMANKIVDDMYYLAPQGETGVLAASIGWTWGDAPAGTMAIGSFMGKAYGTMRITFYAGGGPAFYARFHEFGTKKMDANPFFYPVWRVWAPRVRRAINAAVRRGLRNA